MNSPKCEICIIDVHRASFVKHLGSKKHIENLKQNEMMISECYFKNLSKTKLKKYIILNHLNKSQVIILN